MLINKTRKMFPLMIKNKESIELQFGLMKRTWLPLLIVNALGSCNHIYETLNSGVNPTKLFFFVNKEFLRFLLLSLVCVQYTHFFHFQQTFKLNSENWKTEKMKVWKDWLQNNNFFLNNKRCIQMYRNRC